MKKVLKLKDYHPIENNTSENGSKVSDNKGAQDYLLHVFSEPVQSFTIEFSPISGFKGYLQVNPID